MGDLPWLRSRPVRARTPIEYYSTDTAGNSEPVGSRTFEVDLSAPSDPTALVRGEITANTIALSWSPSSDCGLRCARLRGVQHDWKLLPIATATGSSCVVAGLEPNTPYSLYVKAVDTAGRVSGYSNTVTATTTTTDITPPTTTATSAPSAPDGDAGWYVTAPEITLIPDEPATTYYAFGSDDPATYSPPLSAPQGISTLSFRSTDSAGNAEEHQDRGLPSRHLRAIRAHRGLGRCLPRRRSRSAGTRSPTPPRGSPATRSTKAPPVSAPPPPRPIWQKASLRARPTSSPSRPLMSPATSRRHRTR